MKRALFFTISMLLVTGFLFGQDTKEKMRSIVDSYSLQDYQSEINQFYNYKDLPGKQLNKAIEKYANIVKKEDVLIFHYGGVGFLGNSFIVTNDKLYYYNNINPQPANKSDEIKLRSITRFQWVGADDNIYIYNGDKIVGILYMLGYNKHIAPILISLLDKIVNEAKQDAAKNYVAVPDSSWTLKSIQSNCPDIGEKELCDGSPFYGFTIRGTGGTKEDDGRWWWVNDNTLGLSNFDSGNNKSGGVVISIREGYQVTLKFQFETKGDRNFLGEVFPKFKLNYNNYFDELGDDFFIVTMEGGDALHVDIDDEWSGISSFGLKVFGETIFNEEQKSSSIDDEVYISLIKVKNIATPMISSSIFLDLERKNKDGHVLSFGTGKTEEAAIRHATETALKTMILALKDEEQTFDNLNNKLNLFIKDNSIDYQLLKKLQISDESTNVILSSIIPINNLRSVFNLKVEDDNNAGGMFADIISDDKNDEYELLEYITFMYFFESIDSSDYFDSFYDVIFKFENPINSEFYNYSIKNYSHVITNNIVFNLNEKYNHFLDLLLSLVEIQADEKVEKTSVKNHVKLNNTNTEIGYIIGSYDENLNLLPENEGIKYNNLIAFLDGNMSKIGYQTNGYGDIFIEGLSSLPQPTISLKDVTVFKLKSKNSIFQINEFIKEKLLKIGFETTISFTDGGEEKFTDIFDLDYNYKEMKSSFDIRCRSCDDISKTKRVYGEEFLSSSNEYVKIAISPNSLIQISHKYDKMAKRINDLVIPLEYITIKDMSSSAQRMNTNQSHQTILASISENYNHTAFYNPNETVYERDSYGRISSVSTVESTYKKTNREKLKYIHVGGEYFLNKSYMSNIKSIDVKVLSSQQTAKKIEEEKKTKAKITESKRDGSNFELSTEQVICGCLKSAEYYNLNENACDSYINSALGFNWKTTNFSQNPAADRKFNQLQSMCQ